MRLSVPDERLERSLIDVVLELPLSDGHVEDLVHTLEAHVELGRIGRDHCDRDRSTKQLCRRDELACDIAQLAAQVFGDDQGPIHQPWLTSGSPRRSP